MGCLSHSTQLFDEAPSFSGRPTAHLTIQRSPARPRRSTYGFFPVNTIVDAGEAGELEVDRGAFAALYGQGSIVYKGTLSQADVTTLVERILLSARVRRRFKQVFKSQ